MSVFDDLNTFLSSAKDITLVFSTFECGRRKIRNFRSVYLMEKV